MYIATAFKLLVLPLLVLAPMKIQAKGGLDTLRLTMVLLFATTTPAAPVIFAEQYQGDVPLATQATLVTTALCFVGIPPVMLAVYIGIHKVYFCWERIYYGQ